jgi:hypothetical protein
LRKRWSLVGIPLDTGSDKRMQRRRTPLGDFGTVVSIQDSQGALNRTHVFVGTLPRQQLPTNNAVTKYIRLFIITLVGENFDAHPLDCKRQGKSSEFCDLQD